MSDIKTILVPTDGSEGARKAAAFAGDLARKLGARVLVLAVQSEDSVMPNAWGVGDYPADSPLAMKSVEEIRGILEKRIRDKELPDTASALGKLDDDAEQLFEWGHPVQEICRIAEERDVDLIVIGSHGRSRFARALLGSVSNAVAIHAPCPVTIVR